MTNPWKFYFWQAEGECWILPTVGVSWPPAKGKAIWITWLMWTAAWIDPREYRYTHTPWIDPREYRYTHTHTAARFA